MDEIEQALSRLAAAEADHELGRLEDDVWRGVSAHDARRRRAALIRPVGALGVAGALALGLAAGGSVTDTASATELAVFSPQAALAPSTLLGTAG